MKEFLKTIVMTNRDKAFEAASSLISGNVIQVNMLVRKPNEEPDCIYGSSNPDMTTA
ncbi:MAG: hypothetical protein LBM60_07765 [Clostridium sp.]|nr:hypothetical protein [Clostridium sp.]